jgi:hypothetical protein
MQQLKQKVTYSITSSARQDSIGTSQQTLLPQRA